MNVKMKEATSAAFAPYGEVIERPARPSDASGPGWQWWAEVSGLQGGERPYGLGFLELTPTGLRFDWAERHMHTDELIVPLGGDCLVYVAPADFPEDPGRMPDLERFEVFRVREGQAVLLKPGVWHGAPMAVNEPLRVLVILHRSTGSQDAYIQKFEDRPVEIIFK